ncbi:MAG: hypothetical protein JSV76_03400, partial [Candidatus Bathyarchaeota archaeon]
RRRYSYEYTVLRVLEYLFQKKDSYPISKYHILTKVSSATQRQDRISSILQVLVDNGWITVLKTEKASFYRITSKGEEAYSKWVHDFLLFARSTYSEDLSKSATAKGNRR